MTEDTDLDKPRQAVNEALEEAKLWGNIRRMAETDEGMRNLLDMAIEYYYLKKAKNGR